MDGYIKLHVYPQFFPQSCLGMGPPLSALNTVNGVSKTTSSHHGQRSAMNL